MKARLSLFVVLLGVALIAKGAYIPLKAGVAQILLERAWRQSQRDGTQHRPWPWADTRVVARLESPDHGVDLIALAGADGSSLAFGPGHISTSGLPGSADTVAFGGHRDTHFQFLQDVQIGDRFVLTTTSGVKVRYAVESTEVADSRESQLRFATDSNTLALVTCYPFDAVRAGGPLRYVVAAKAYEVSL